MSDYFKSIKKGAEEALAWKKGQKTCARVRRYTAMDVAGIGKKGDVTGEGG
mgnify:CR=1 FL=1